MPNNNNQDPQPMQYATPRRIFRKGELARKKHLKE